MIVEQHKYKSHYGKGAQFADMHWNIKLCCSTLTKSLVFLCSGRYANYVWFGRLTCLGVRWVGFLLVCIFDGMRCTLFRHLYLMLMFFLGVEPHSM